MVPGRGLGPRRNTESGALSFACTESVMRPVNASYSSNPVQTAGSVLAPCPQGGPRAVRPALPSLWSLGRGHEEGTADTLAFQAKKLLLELHFTTATHSPFLPEPALQLAGSPRDKSWPRKGCPQRTAVLGMPGALERLCLRLRSK